MTASDYWDGDSTLVKDYRKAEEMRTRRKNQELWLQGMYDYEAVCCATPLMQPFAKKGTKAHPYASEPYPMTKEEAQEREDREERKLMQQGIEKMKRVMASVNAKFDKKGR